MESETRDFGETSGWNEKLDEDKNLNQKVIDLANSKYPLSEAFNKYNVKFEESYSITGWAYKCICPFPDHKDSAPSFGYNPTVGAFNCFGCHRGGKAVEFIAHMEQKSRISVARSIVGNYSSNDLIILNSNFDFERMRSLLFGFADNIRAFKIKNNNKEAFKYAKAVNWNLDVYLRRNVPMQMIILDDLEARIKKLNSQLLAYGDSD